MIKLRTTLALLILVMTGSAAYSEEPGSDSRLSINLKKLADDNNLAGTQFVAVVDENGLVSFDKYSTEKQYFDENSQFLIASHTKALTSTLASVLHAEHKIDLHKPVAHYDKSLLTNEKLDANTVTLHQLLTHTGGFTSIQHSFKTAFLGYQNQADAVGSLNFNTLVAPNKKFRYSNTGPIVAAMAMESALDKNWQTLMQEHLFAPLGMKDTTTVVTENLVPSIITSSDQNVFRSGHFKTDNTMHASGGITSTANDLARWLVANINGKSGVLSKSDALDLLHTKQVEQDRSYFTYKRTGYTLGWDVAEYNGETLLTRFGTYAGYSLHVSFMPERKLGVIAFTNQDIAFALPHVIANYAYNSKLKKSNAESNYENESDRLKESIKKQLSAAPDVGQIVSANAISQSIFGTFSNDQNWPPMTVSNENGELIVTWGVLNGVLLKSDDKYIAHLGAITRPLKIQVNEKGKVELFNGSLRYEKI